MSAYGQVFSVILRSYDLALKRSGNAVESRQRSNDVLDIVVDYHRKYQEDLAKRREKRRLAREAKEANAAKLSAEAAPANQPENEVPSPQQPESDVAKPPDNTEPS